MEENGQKLRIALGSASSQKIGYLREVLAEIGIKAEVNKLHTRGVVGTAHRQNQSFQVKDLIFSGFSGN